jgi:hypothetical protein
MVDDIVHNIINEDLTEQEKIAQNKVMNHTVMLESFILKEQKLQDERKRDELEEAIRKEYEISQAQRVFEQKKLKAANEESKEQIYRILLKQYREKKMKEEEELEFKNAL